MKIALALEEFQLPYDAIPVDTRKGEQHTDAYRQINPNAKAPSIDDAGNIVFDSNAILIYLAEKTGTFMPSEPGTAARADMLSWLMFVATGIGPYSGQCVHFRIAAPEPKEYALNRYDYEAERHWAIVDQRLATHRYMLGDDYSIVDMAVWGWARMLPLILGDEQIWSRFPNLKRLMDDINARPAAIAAEKLRTSHEFKTDMDDQAKRAMFPQNERLG